VEGKEVVRWRVSCTDVGVHSGGVKGEEVVGWGMSWSVVLTGVEGV
jgi:hypothetical protein